MRPLSELSAGESAVGVSAETGPMQNNESAIVNGTTGFNLMAWVSIAWVHSSG